MIKTSYLQPIFNRYEYKLTLEMAIETITDWADKNEIEFGAIAFTGVSGAGLAFPLSLELDKALLCVRKTNSSHSEHEVEGDFSEDKYIIVDDFTETNGTIDTIIEKIGTRSKCVGVYFYKPSIFTLTENHPPEIR